jgi:hypothetical protein
MRQQPEQTTHKNQTKKSIRTCSNRSKHDVSLLFNSKNQTSIIHK